MIGRVEAVDRSGAEKRKDKQMDKQVGEYVERERENGKLNQVRTRSGMSP